MNACTIMPYVKNGKGEIVESKLFNSLLSHFPNQYKEAWRHYDLATSQEFLSQISDASFDENGEINIRDYFEALGMQEPSPSVEEALNKELNAGTYSYQEAIEKVAAFNRSRPEGSRYIATLRPTKDSKVFSIEVAQDTDFERETMKNIIRGRNLQEQIISYLAQHGVSVDFINANYSRYSTENATKNANGLYQLIEFSKHGTPIELAEEAGHFIIGSLSSNPLISRLESLLQAEEVQREILGDEYSTKDLGDNPAREIAGVVVGKALINQLETTSAIGKLAQRIKNAAKKIFAKLSGDKIRLAILEAEELAKNFANEFLTSPLESDVTEALKILETRYHRDLKREQSNIQTLVTQLSLLSEELRPLSQNASLHIENILSAASDASGSLTVGLFSLDGILTALDGLCVFAKEYLEPLVSGDALAIGKSGIELASALQEESRKLAVYTIFLRRASDLYSTFKYVNENLLSDAQLKLDHTFTDKFKYLGKFLKDGSKEFYNIYELKARNIAAKFLEQIYGAPFVARQERVLWNTEVAEAENITMDHIAHYLDEDDSFTQLFLGGIVNSVDPGAQIIGAAIRDAETVSNNKLAQIHSVMDALFSQAKKHGVSDTSIFYERDDEGKLTGNLKFIIGGTLDLSTGTISPTMELQWWKYEREYKTFLQEQYKAFVESPEGKRCANMPPRIRRLRFKMWSKKATSQWQREHAEFDDVTEQLIPKRDKYAIPCSLTSDQLSWYNSYKDVFNDLKQQLGSNKMQIQLAPQVRGSFANTVWNFVSEKKSLPRAIANTIWRKTVELLTREPSLINESSHHNFNTEEDVFDNFFKEDHNVSTERSRILPLFFVSKIKDTTRLDTNLYAATMHFAAMACKYEAMSAIIDALRITDEALSNRQVDSRTKRSPIVKFFRSSSNTSDIIREYVDTSVYGLNYGLLTHLTKFNWARKYLAVAGKATTLWYLGGNVLSQGVNALTGTLEILKEGFAGEHYNAIDLLWALGRYVWDIPHIIYDFATQKDSAKTNLFGSQLEAIDTSTTDEYRYRGWAERFFSKFGISSLALFGYRAGGHYMNLIPYMALARSTKLYTIRGKKTNLWKALEPSEASGKALDSSNKIIRAKQKFLTLLEPHFRSRSDRYAYLVLKDAIDNLTNAPTAILSNSSFLGDEVMKYLQDEGISEDTVNNLDREALLKILQDMAESKTFNMVDLAGFARKAREVTNRLHGVQDKLSKTVLHRSIIGTLLFPFKGYAFGMLQRRYGGLFGGAKYSVTLDKEDQGSQVSVIKSGLYTGKQLIKVAQNIIRTVNPEENVSRTEYLREVGASLTRSLGIWAASILPTSKTVEMAASKLHVNKNMIYGNKRAVLDILTIVGINALMHFSAMMAMGGEDDKELDTYTIQELLQYCEKNNIKISSKERSDFENEISLTNRKLSNIKRQAEQSHITNSEINEAVKEGVRDYLLSQIKNVNKIRAEKTRPEWQLSYYLINRLRREQEAFNTYKGFNFEGKSLLDPMPISFNCIADLCDIGRGYLTTDPFYNSTIYIAGQPRSVEQLIDIVNDPNVDKRAKILITKQLEKHWENFGSKAEFKKYIHDRRKKGHHRRFDPKWKTLLNNKRPSKRIDYIKQGGDQAVRDYNFGTMYN